MTYEPSPDAAAEANNARVVLERTMDLMRQLFDSIELPVEVALIAVQVGVEGFGPMVVTLTHPIGEFDRVADIANQAEEIFRREAQ